MESTDVLVIGSGIAGLCAAIEAARTGATVAVASAGKTMSGSSFFPGTWGLGLIGPVNQDDEQDLIDTIQTVGGGVADPELVQTFVHGIPQAIEWLEQDLGVELQRPQSAESAQQKQFIPCFDYKTRMWRGLTRKPLEDALTTRIESSVSPAPVSPSTVWGHERQNHQTRALDSPKMNRALLQRPRSSQPVAQAACSSQPYVG
ncbi:MAG: FAD-dependent oxidoreductase [Collinsella sp.]